MTNVTINNDESPCRNITVCSGRIVVPMRSTDNCTVCAIWQPGPFGNCTPNCHLGNQERVVQCIDEDTGNVLSDVHCDLTNCPATSQRTIDHAISQCSRTCEGGSQRRKVECYSPMEDKVLPDQECNLATRPRSYRTCNNDIPGGCIDLYPDFCPRIMGTPLCMDPSYYQVCCMSCGTDK
ncbi:ADAMTS-like protein 4 [Dysidea avara]|uniref:ADAMTS-like protein 4 n=1 Tax=Dysidea avara TaxID=196820 RepID=UPI0033239455